MRKELKTLEKEFMTELEQKQKEFEEKLADKNCTKEEAMEFVNQLSSMCKELKENQQKRKN